MTDMDTAIDTLKELAKSSVAKATTGAMLNVATEAIESLQAKLKEAEEKLAVLQPDCTLTDLTAEITQQDELLKEMAEALGGYLPDENTMSAEEIEEYYSELLDKIEQEIILRNGKPCIKKSELDSD